MKTLVIFDFDDTLFESHNHVIVKTREGQIKYLTTHEYAQFEPSEGDKLDFSQFDGYPNNPRPIEASIRRLHNAVRLHGLDNVIILTARAYASPIEEVLRDFSLPQIYVAAVGGSNPALKAEYTVRTVNEENYSKVIVYEDNIKNIVAIKKAVIPIIGPENFSAYNVKQHQSGHRIVRH